MCCLSEASSHFVVFVCVNPDRKPSRKMHRLNASSTHRLTIYSGTLIFLLRLGIINAGHFDKLSDRIVSALVAQETRQAQ